MRNGVVEMEANIFSSGKVHGFFSPNKIILGPGSSNLVGHEAKTLGGKKALIVTDQGIIKTGMTEAIKESLLSSNVDVVLFDRVELETPSRLIREGARFARDEKCDVLVALGGGTTLDTTKGISVMAANKGSVLDYVGVNRVPIKGLPKIMIPTTGGSGSEVTRGFGVTDETEKTKKAVSSLYNLADVVILDPLLTLSLPPLLTAETGLDALAHAIEAYVSQGATPFSDLLALEAIRLVGKSLLPAYAKGKTVEARLDMLLAATLAGLAFSSGGLGAVHAFSFVLESDHGMGHARAVAAILPHVMEFNKVGALRKYGSIAVALGEKTEGLSDFHAAGVAVTAVRRMLEATNISSRLSDYGISEDNMPGLVAGTLKQDRLFVSNPRNLTEQDVRNIYLRAL
jgi:alcohol dehydrogenase class IV